MTVYFVSYNHVYVTGFLIEKIIMDDEMRKECGMWSSITKFFIRSLTSKRRTHILIKSSSQNRKKIECALILITEWRNHDDEDDCFYENCWCLPVCIMYNDNMVLSKENIIHDDHLQIVYYGKVDNNSDKTIAAIFFKHESLMLFCLYFTSLWCSCCSCNALLFTSLQVNLGKNDNRVLWLFL